MRIHPKKAHIRASDFLIVKASLNKRHEKIITQMGAVYKRIALTDMEVSLLIDRK
jgi:hypothetical protein